ncbi:MAG TPA: lipocalin-like domain-containing protein [Micropepsaceae bacterium]|nr:lipocalin-like domain-containing protein [Micropepsaceae bacterium]
MLRSVWLSAATFALGVLYLIGAAHSQTASSRAGAQGNSPVLPAYREVRPGVALQFPADHGAHPEFRSEWWYITGWLDTGKDRALGFQVTFFRFRPAIDQRNPSAFAPKQILFAHAALSDPKVGRLLHDQRASRAGFGRAEAATQDADIVLDDWTLKRGADDIYHAKVGGKEFSLDLSFKPTQAILLEGDDGFSRKGPFSNEASHYYSEPHLEVSGTVKRGAESLKVTGTAWLDREWSSTYLDPRAVGWDWVGLNLDDGGALMVFRIRDAAGDAFWAGGSLREGDGALHRLQPDDIRFEKKREWRSPRTGAIYPVEQTLSVHLPAGERQWRLSPLFDDQELDSRIGGGPVYWEGAVRTQGGRGYLELTGYFQPLKM